MSKNNDKVIKENNEKNNGNIKSLNNGYDQQENERLLSTNEADKMLKEFDVNDLTMDSFNYIVAPRRTGKTVLVSSIISQYRKKNPVDAVFLFSKSNAGFEDQIPSSYRFRSLDHLQSIIDIQLRVKKYNQKQKKDSDKVSSKVIVILDDMLDGSKSVHSSPLITKLSSLGRHISFKESHNDLKGNGIMTFILSQSLVMCNPITRRNCDWVFFSKVADKNERRAIVEQYLTLRSSRGGMREAYNINDVVNLRNFQFLCVNATCSNKYDYDDYVYKYIAQEKIPKQHWSGTPQDWKNNQVEIVW